MAPAVGSGGFPPIVLAFKAVAQNWVCFAVFVFLGFGGLGAGFPRRRVRTGRELRVSAAGRDLIQSCPGSGQGRNRPAIRIGAGWAGSAGRGGQGVQNRRAIIRIPWGLTVCAGGDVAGGGAVGRIGFRMARHPVANEPRERLVWRGTFRNRRFAGCTVPSMRDEDFDENPRRRGIWRTRLLHRTRID